MKSYDMFDEDIKRKLKYYIYLDPDTNDIFYVGKGKGNRVFSHLKDTPDSKSKINEKIREIRNKNKEPQIEILLHGIDDEYLAKKVEAAVIDLLNKSVGERFRKGDQNPIRYVEC